MENKKLNQMNKQELTSILVNDYGYSKSDLKDNNGKPYTNATLVSMINKEREEEESLRVEVKKEVEDVKEESADIYNIEENLYDSYEAFDIKDDDLIVVMSGVSKDLIHRSKRTGRMWKFTRFGQTDKMPFIELVTIHNVNPSCFEDGRLIILNKKVAKNFNLDQMYNNIITPQSLDKLILEDTPEGIISTIENLPKGMKNTFFSRARDLYEQNKIDSVSTIKTIENYYGVSLEDNAPLSDIAVKSDKER